MDEAIGWLVVIGLFALLHLVGRHGSGEGEGGGCHHGGGGRSCCGGHGSEGEHGRRRSRPLGTASPEAEGG